MCGKCYEHDYKHERGTRNDNIGVLLTFKLSIYRSRFPDTEQNGRIILRSSQEYRIV